MPIAMTQTGGKQFPAGDRSKGVLRHASA